MERWGGVDVLVNNAGVARDGVIALADDDDVDTVVDLNLKGTLQMTKLVVRRMLSGGHGHIVNVSSIVGLSGYRGLVVYSATKAALDGMTRALARELGSRGITVNSVAPGYLRTEMSHGLDEEQLEQIVRRTPAGRLGEPGRHRAGRAVPHRARPGLHHRPGDRGRRRSYGLTTGQFPRSAGEVGTCRGLQPLPGGSFPGQPGKLALAVVCNPCQVAVSPVSREFAPGLTAVSNP